VAHLDCADRPLLTCDRRLHSREQDLLLPDEEFLRGKVSLQPPVLCPAF
jgi:hypothetical protein